MFTQIGSSVGLIFCLSLLVFRWKTVVGKYGSLSLYWWLLAVVAGCSLVGLMVDLALWAVLGETWGAAE